MKFKQYLTEMAEQEALAVFGLSQDALGNKSMIQKRFKDLAKTYHPDKGGPGEKMEKLNTAYDVLKKSKKTKLDTGYGKQPVRKGQKLDGYY